MARKDAEPTGCPWVTLGGRASSPSLRSHCRLHLPCACPRGELEPEVCEAHFLQQPLLTQALLPKVMVKTVADAKRFFVEVVHCSREDRREGKGRWKVRVSRGDAGGRRVHDHAKQLPPKLVSSGARCCPKAAARSPRASVKMAAKAARTRKYWVAFCLQVVTSVTW